MYGPYASCSIKNNSTCFLMYLVLFTQKTMIYKVVRECVQQEYIPLGEVECQHCSIVCKDFPCLTPINSSLSPVKLFVWATLVVGYSPLVLYELLIKVYEKLLLKYTPLVAMADPGWDIWGKCPPFKKLHTRSRYSNRAVDYSNKAVTMFMRQCSLPMKL